jgi:hypothetical protein
MEGWGGVKRMTSYGRSSINGLVEGRHPCSGTGNVGAGVGQEVEDLILPLCLRLCRLDRPMDVKNLTTSAVSARENITVT